MTIKGKRAAALEKAYREGWTINAAAARCDVAFGTAWSYFDKFAAAGIPRGSIKRRKEGPRRRYGSPQPYTGPDWIGKPA